MDEKLRQQFDEMGIEITDNQIGKCMDLCITHHLDDAVEFVEMWMAFSLSNFHSAEPTVDHLAEFERKVLQANHDKEKAAAGLAAKKLPSKYPSAIANRSHLTATPRTTRSPAAETKPLPIYGGTAMDDVSGGTVIGMDADDDDDAMLESYNATQTPKHAKGVLARTPARRKDALFSPASYSPVSSGTPRSHTASAGSGKIVYTFGNPALLNAADWNSAAGANNNSKQRTGPQLAIKQLLLHDGHPLGATLPAAPANNVKYMFDNLREKADIIGDRIFHIGQGLCAKTFAGAADDYELQAVDEPSQGTIRTIGQICCDHDGPLDAASTLLIDSDEMRCRTVRLNLSQAKTAALFPGQVAMVTGRNARGDVLLVDEVITDRPLTAPGLPRFSDPLTFVVAAGPYTNDDDLVYDPLSDLLAYLKTNQPDVLVLVGPFLDAEHKMIGGEEVTLAETFDSFFENMIAGIVDTIGTATTKILIVASHRDANADPVYPTPPLQLKQRTYGNVHMLPDPSLIDLNGIVIGVTATDTVDHILSHELAVNAGDKVKRVVSHLFNQATFYPLQPPPEDRMCYDSLLASRYARLDQVPHVVILPSDQKCFIRVVNGCLALNPGRVTAPSGGTFARFVITPPVGKDEPNLFSYVGCQVRKV